MQNERMRPPPNACRVLPLSRLLGWPGQTEKEFHFPRHLDEALSDWEDVKYTQKLRAPEDAQHDSEFGTDYSIKDYDGPSVATSVYAWFNNCINRFNFERPTNPSSWMEERWDQVRKSEADDMAIQQRRRSAYTILPEVLVEAPGNPGGPPGRKARRYSLPF